MIQRWKIGPWPLQDGRTTAQRFVCAPRWRFRIDELREIEPGATFWAWALELGRFNSPDVYVEVMRRQKCLSLPELVEMANSKAARRKPSKSRIVG
jgi:hypothetical protein